MNIYINTAEALQEHEIITDLLEQWTIDRTVEGSDTGPERSVVGHVEWLQERVRRLEDRAGV